MINIRLASTVLMVSLLFSPNISQVMGTPFKIMNKSHDSMDQSDLRSRSLVYEAYFPDYHDLKRQEQSFKSQPVVHHSWRNLYNGRKIRSSYVTTRNPFGHSLPLLKSPDNHSGNGNRRGIESQKGYYRYVTDTASNSLAKTFGHRPGKLIEHQTITSKLHNRGDVFVKTHFNCHKQGASPIYQGAYYKTAPKVLTPQINAHDQSVKSVSNKENIYQPRSQVIQYKFNSPYKLLGRIGKWNPSKPVYDHNIIDNDRGIPKQYQHHSVESDQTHKIRHHHGEWRRPFF